MNSATKLKFGLSLIFLVGIAAIGISASKDPCANPRDRVLILIDQTDEISPLAKDAIWKHVNELMTKASAGTSFKIRFLRPESVTIDAPTACRPDSVSAATELYKNLPKTEQRWRDFSTQVQKAIFSQISPSPSSPIYEGILDEVRNEFIGVKGTRTLAVFSDFRQYTPGRVNLHHSCSDPQSQYEKIRAALTLIPPQKEPQRTLDTERPLNGVRVLPFLVSRADMNSQFTECVISVAEMYFNRLSGEATKLERFVALPVSKGVSQ